MKGKIAKQRKILCLVFSLIFMFFLFANTSNTTANDLVDTSAPVLKAINFNSTTVKPGKSLTLSVIAEDDLSGVRSVFIAFKSPSGTQNGQLSLAIKDEAGNFSGSFKLPEDAELGDWFISYISLEDFAGNILRSFYQDGYAYQYDNHGNYLTVEAEPYTFKVIEEVPTIVIEAPAETELSSLDLMVQEAIEAVGATSIQDRGKVLGYLKPILKDSITGEELNDRIEKFLD